MSRTILWVAALALGISSSAAFAQTQTDTGTPPPPPPIIEAPPQQQPPPQQQQAPQDAPKVDTNQAPTPPPPGAHLPGSQPQSGYQYSPYGAPINTNAPPPHEYGLMATEFLFGALTSAPIVLLPYLLFLRPAIQAASAGALAAEDATLVNILFLVIFASVPVAAAQTEIGLANGSRFYYSESWPAYLSGLGMEALVVGIYLLMGSANSAAEPWLLVGTLIGVPAAETVVINLTKTPRNQMPYGGMGLVRRSSDGEWRVATPTPLPLFAYTSAGLSVGAQVPVLSGMF